MHKTTLKHKRGRHHDFDLTQDWENILDKLVETKDAIADAAYDVKGSAGALLSNTVENFKDNIVEKSSLAKDNVTNFVQERPITSISLATGFGIILGYFLHK